MTVSIKLLHDSKQTTATSSFRTAAAQVDSSNADKAAVQLAPPSSVPMQLVVIDAL